MWLSIQCLSCTQAKCRLDPDHGAVVLEACSWRQASQLQHISPHEATNGRVFLPDTSYKAARPTVSSVATWRAVSEDLEAVAHFGGRGGQVEVAENAASAEKHCTVLSPCQVCVVTGAAVSAC